MLLNLLLCVVNKLIGFVLKVDDFFGGFIRLLGGLGFLDHAVDI